MITLSQLTDKVMPFGDHLEELRRRLMFALGGVIPIFIISVVFGKTLLSVLLAPAWEALDREGLPVEMLQTGPMEVFFAYFKVSLVMTVVIGSPWIIYQLWRFIAPGLYSRERKFVHILAPMSAALAILGCVFLYYVLLPVTLTFFVQFGMSVASRSPGHAAPPPGVALPSIPVLDADPIDPLPGQMWVNRDLKQLRIAVDAARVEGTPVDDAADNQAPIDNTVTEQPPTDPGALPVHTGGPEAIRSGHGPIIVLGTPLVKDALIRQQYRVSEMVSLVLSFALGIAAAFQVPVIVLLLGWMGVVTPKILGKYRRQAAFVCLILGAIITPTGDPVTLAMMTIPLFLLYELGGVLLRLMPPAPGEPENDDNDTSPDNDPSSPTPSPAPAEEEEPELEERSIIAPPREGADSIVPRDPYNPAGEVGDDEPEPEGDGPSRYETDDEPLPPPPPTQ